MKNKICVAFCGGGTGGHIYPGLAVADFLRKKFCEKKSEQSEKTEQSGRSGRTEKIEPLEKTVRFVWLGTSAKMDKKIVESSLFEIADAESEIKKIGTFAGGTSAGENSASGVSAGESEISKKTIDKFYALPSGKLRRYFSVKNFFDVFKIAAGFFAAFFVLLKERPVLLFSKGGFASVPPCVAAKLLGIKVYTHECDFTPGLATKINSKFAHKILLSYEETKKYFRGFSEKKFVVTGNPIRPAFYKADAAAGKKFIFKNEEGGSGKKSETELPILLVTGGSLGAAQINSLVFQNLTWLCEHFCVVHQTGKNAGPLLHSENPVVQKNYHPFEFIYEQMADVFSAADIVLSRAGANSIWEAAALFKAAVLLPLEGSGTRGDQVDNAEFFEKNGAAIVIRKADANSENLKNALTRLFEKSERQKFSDACKKICGSEKPAKKIADLLFFENFCEEKK